MTTDIAPENLKPDCVIHSRIEILAMHGDYGGEERGFLKFRLLLMPQAVIAIVPATASKPNAVSRRVQ